MHETCRLCRAPEMSLHFRVRGMDLMRCDTCGFVQVHTQHLAGRSRDLYAADYFDHGKYVNDRAVTLEHGRRLDMLADAGLSTGALVLDAGCAVGDFVNAAGDCYQSYGTDISCAAISLGKTLFPAIANRLAVGSLTNPPFADKRFDAIVLWDVIEHLPQPLQAIQAMVALLKPGGLIALSTPNIGAMTARITGRFWAFMTPPEHVSFFNKSSMARLVRCHGLEPIKWASRGKWANVGFLTYKLSRIFPRLITAGMVQYCTNSRLGRSCVYVPTGDVQYMVARLT